MSGHTLYLKFIRFPRNRFLAADHSPEASEGVRWLSVRYADFCRWRLFSPTRRGAQLCAAREWGMKGAEGIFFARDKGAAHRR